MKKRTYRVLLLSTSLGILFSSDVSALDLTFQANIRETTCDMYISGGSASGETASSTNITIGPSGQVRLDEIINGTTGSGNNTATFALNIKECPPGLANIKTKLTATAASPSTVAIKNTASSGAAANIGVTISRQDTPATPFVINSTTDAEMLIWTPADITAKKVDLLSRLVLVGTDITGATGNYTGTATFNFTYN